MLKKNFGVTRNGRVVFYDYDEICYLTECKFRKIPPAPSYEDEMSDTPWYSIGAHDVFPESFGPFFFPFEKDMNIFRQNHAELMEAGWWNQTKENIINGSQADLFPYPEKQRFKKHARPALEKQLKL